MLRNSFTLLLITPLAILIFQRSGSAWQTYGEPLPGALLEIDFPGDVA